MQAVAIRNLQLKHKNYALQQCTFVIYYTVAFHLMNGNECHCSIQKS